MELRGKADIPQIPKGDIDFAELFEVQGGKNESKVRSGILEKPLVLVRLTSLFRTTRLNLNRSSLDFFRSYWTTISTILFCPLSDLPYS